MPRVTRGAAVLLALVIATAGIGAVASFSFTSPSQSAEIGSSVEVNGSLPATGSYAVHLFGGTAQGTSSVIVGGKVVKIPVAGTVFSAASIVNAHGGTTLSAAIPDDPSLIGEKVTWVAVVVDQATGRIVAVVRTGGPIIEDAIC